MPSLSLPMAEPGCAIPPHGPHSITCHLPGWEWILKFKTGDINLTREMKSMYPRFMPFNLVARLCDDMTVKILGPQCMGLDGAIKYGCLAFVHPDIFALAGDWVRNVQGLELGVIKIDKTLLYCVLFPSEKLADVLGLWQITGTGISSRLAEHLLKNVGSMVEVDTWATGIEGGLPQTDAHQKLRERIADLVEPAPAKTHERPVTPQDVFLYPTGMAAIHRMHQACMRVRAGSVVALGALFHSTEHIFEQSVYGFRYFGNCRANSGVMGALERHLKEQRYGGKVVSFVFLEFPSNPILNSLDLVALRTLADEYGFFLVVDDTIGSFCNVDLLPVVDVMVTSLTKSFSGYADVMGGSAIISPFSSSYAKLRVVWDHFFCNELFAGDAAHLLSNSDDYLARSAVLNRNAAAVAHLLHSSMTDDQYSPVAAVLYPSLVDAQRYGAFMRSATDEFAPGHGCLLSVEFVDMVCTATFYDNLKVHHGPHFGAHRTLAFAYNENLLGSDSVEGNKRAEWGIKAEQIRISVGLEPVEDLLGVVTVALEAAREVPEVVRTKRETA